MLNLPIFHSTPASFSSGSRVSWWTTQDCDNSVDQ